MAKLSHSGIDDVRFKLRNFTGLRFPSYNPCPAIDNLHGYLVTDEADIVADIDRLIHGEAIAKLYVPDSLYRMLKEAKDECGAENEVLIEQFEAYIAALQELVDQVKNRMI